MSATNSNLIQCSPEELMDLLRLTPRFHTLFIWGPPGIGKTDLVNQFAVSVHAQVVTVRASEMEPQDLIGLPDLSGDCTVFKPSRRWGRKEEADRRDTPSGSKTRTISHRQDGV